MRIHWGLLRWFFRQTWPLNGAVMVVLLVLLVLASASWQASAIPGMVGIAVFIVGLAHPLGLVMLLGRYRSTEFAFLYTRGFSRNALWGHIMLFTALSIVLAWFPVWVFSLTPLPQWLYSFAGVEGAPYPLPSARFFRVMSSFISYPLLIPALHYAWIRQAQPDRNSEAGFWIPLAVVWGGIGPQRLENIVPIFRIVWLGVGLLLLVWSYRLHRSMEVRP